jgi:hypothetical protein
MSASPTLTGTIAGASLQLSSLTSGRVTYATTSGLLTDSANLLYSGTDLTVYGITVGRGAGAVSTNTAVGNTALAVNTTGSRNTAVGYFAALYTTGSSNTAVGISTLAGSSGTATGSANTAIGDAALTGNTSGANNTAVGVNALNANTTASNNTAVGYQAGYSNTTGPSNTFIGQISGYTNTTGESLTFVGRAAGYNNTTGIGNTFVGGRSATTSNLGAGYAVTTGSYNTFIGGSAGGEVTTGSKNTIIGAYNGNQGGLDIRTASNYIVLSDGDGNPRLISNGSGEFAMGENPVAGYRLTLKGSDATASNHVLFARNSASTNLLVVRNDGYFSTGTATNSPYNATTGSAANVFVDSGGQLFRSTSSLKYKKNVQGAVHGLADVLKLRAVTYEGKAEADAGKTFGGLIAEEVHDAGLTEFVQYAEDGTPDALAYGNMVSLCIKAIQELKSELDSVKAELATLKGN